MTNSPTDTATATITTTISATTATATAIAYATGKVLIEQPESRYSLGPVQRMSQGHCSAGE